MASAGARAGDLARRLAERRAELLAAALETTPDALGGAGMEAPPGRGHADRSPHLEALDPDKCVRRLSGGGVGRVVFVNDSGPAALPVSFALLDGDVVFRTDEEGSIARAVGSGPATVSFEVDQTDEALREGWSVLMHGEARRIQDEDELSQARNLGIEPWSGRELDLYLRITPTAVSGRRIRVLR